MEDYDANNDTLWYIDNLARYWDSHVREPRFIEGEQKPPQGFNAHHTDNARYFLIITPFPLARIVTRRGLYG